MFPFIKSSPTYTLDVPSLKGGLNLRDGLSLVNDDQMTESKNMWFREGALRTRPRIQAYNNYSSNVNNDYWCNIYGLSDGSAVVYADPQHKTKKKGGTIEYNYAAIVIEKESGGTTNTEISFLYFSGGDSDGASKINAGTISDFSDKVIDNIFTIESEGYFYSFICGHDRGTNDAPKRLGIFRSNIDEEDKLVEMEDWNLFEPTVIINAKPTESENVGVNGTGVYSYNVLGNRYKMECILPKSIEGDLKLYYYTLPIPISHSETADNVTNYVAFDWASGQTVTAEITYDDGTVVEHSVYIGQSLADYGFMEGNQTDTNGVANKDDGYIMCVRNATVCFYTKSGNNYNLACISVGAVTQSNMVISSVREVNEDNAMKIFSMTKSIWYGGSAEGLYGGTRLFIGGNLNQSDGALMMWSDLNNPLYWPEYNYAYVGTPSKRISAFGRQGETLVILKEKELHQIPYVASVEVTVEQLQAQSVIDLASQSVTFPIYQIHGYIGCDCPNTVQLCRNRLVWANSDGKVYALITENQFNERAVFEVGEMIEPRLKQEYFLHAAYSIDWEDHYILICKSNIYVMDYNSYGYNYVSSFSKVEDANIKIPWYYWEFNWDKGVAPLAVFENSGKLMIPVIKDIHDADAIENNNDYGFVVSVHYLDGSYGDDAVCEFEFDTGEYTLTAKPQPIESVVQTKLYDFGQPSKLKTVPQVHLMFGYNNSVPIDVKFFSEKAINDEHRLVIVGEKALMRSPQFFTTFRVFPYTRGTISFGAHISCFGELIINSITLQYKSLGGAK
jgi:hypothetical protein